MIVLSAGYFTNGVEWLGYRWGLGDGVSGSLLAALGTALPETLVPLMAFVLAKAPHEEAIGLGAILGAPFMLSTLGFAVIGLGVYWSRGHKAGLRDLTQATVSDLRFYLAAFGIAVVAAFLPASWHPFIGVALVFGYGAHAWRLVRQGHTLESDPPSQGLHLSRAPNPRIFLILSQVGLALCGLIIGAHFFVVALSQVTGWIRVSGFLVSVIVTPLATELPEVLNSVIWLRRHKDSLAVGNVTGALAFQASLVPALGLWLTPWHFSLWETGTALLAWLAGCWSLARARDGVLEARELLAPGLLYLLFIGLVVAVL